MWCDIACILFAATAANHLGLVSAIERVAGVRLPIVNCPKCLTFWWTLAALWRTDVGVAGMLAISFGSAYLSVWLELSMGLVDTLYDKLYDKIDTTATDDTSAPADIEEDTGDEVSDVRKESGCAQDEKEQMT